MSVVSESEEDIPNVNWNLSLDVKIQGIPLPFRLRISTDDLDAVHDSLANFQAIIVEKIQQLG